MIVGRSKSIPVWQSNHNTDGVRDRTVSMEVVVWCHCKRSPGYVVSKAYRLPGQLHVCASSEALRLFEQSRLDFVEYISLFSVISGRPSDNVKRIYNKLFDTLVHGRYKRYTQRAYLL